MRLEQILVAVVEEFDRAHVLDCADPQLLGEGAAVVVLRRAL
jgi:hypothetical protein